MATVVRTASSPALLPMPTMTLPIEPAMLIVPEELRCRYSSKPCWEPRTTKRGGGLHRFCVHHRARANENQWRVDHRRRLRRMEATNYADQRAAAGKRTRAARAATATEMVQRTELPVLIPSDCPVGSETTGLQLTSEELQILQYLLFSDNDEEPTIFPL